MGLTRTELFQRMQMIRLMQPLTKNALAAAEDYYWKTGADADPHGRPWHTSFHASSFPGENKMACPRASLYTLMGFPMDKPFKGRSRMFMEQGKAIETAIVTGYYHQGILLSPPPWSPVQLGFSDSEVWLTGNTDAVIRHPLLRRPHVVEVKARQQKILDQMLVGLRGPDESHVIQAKTYVAGMHELSKVLWPKMAPLRDGSILYVSMDDPDITAEYLIEYDPDFYEAGREQLRQWREWFEEDILPSINPSKRHPMGWRWTYPPCNWCDHGQICRKDHKDGVITLSESHGVGHARGLDEEYDPERFREAVEEAWRQS